MKRINSFINEKLKINKDIISKQDIYEKGNMIEGIMYILGDINDYSKIMDIITEWVDESTKKVYIYVSNIDIKYKKEYNDIIEYKDKCITLQSTDGHLLTDAVKTVIKKGENIYKDSEENIKQSKYFITSIYSYKNALVIMIDGWMPIYIEKSAYI